MVTPHKFLVAVLALKILFPCVSFQMAMQLIRACELPITEWPGAHVRFFSCMRAQVGFKVRRFAIYLATARVVANVSAPFRSFSCLLDFCAVGADTVGSLRGLACVWWSEDKWKLPIYGHN